MQIITFANQKGGVGKTTSVQNVGAGLAKLGKKVCLVDLDPQGNLTEGCGVENVDDLKYTTYDLLLNDIHPDEIILTINENLSILPANIDLAGAEVALPTLPGKDHRLKEALEKLEGFDYCLVDAPPSLGQLTLNALTAANGVIIPVQTEFYSYKALKRLLSTISDVKKYMNPHLAISGILCTFFREQRTLNKDIEQLLREGFGTTVFKTKIRDNIKLAETPSAGQDIFTYNSNCQGAWDYKALCDEIVEMEKRNGN